MPVVDHCQRTLIQIQIQMVKNFHLERKITKTHHCNIIAVYIVLNNDLSQSHCHIQMFTFISVTVGITKYILHARKLVWKQGALTEN